MDIRGPVTKENLQRIVPSRKGAITDEAVDLINSSLEEAEFQGQSLLESISTYESVMVKNRVGMLDFINAIRFCAYLLTMDDNYTEAYKKTFIKRKFVFDRLDVDTESSQYKELTSAASRYRNSKLVVDILTIADVPLYILFQGARWKAVSVLAKEMVEAPYSKDRISAADKLLTHVKPPENIQIEMDISVKENSAVQSLNDQLAALAVRQKSTLESGVSDLKELGALKPKEEVIDVEPE